MRSRRPADNPAQIDNLWALVRRLLANGGGGSSASVPLSRTDFIDGGNTGSATPNGAIASPWRTTEAWAASLGPPSSPEDGATVQCAILTPALGGYTPAGGTLTLQSSRSLALRGAISNPEDVLGGQVINGNVVLPNHSTGASAPGTVVLSLGDLVVTGNLTVTDAGPSRPPAVIIYFPATGYTPPPVPLPGVLIGGTLDMSGSPSVEAVVMVGGIVQGDVLVAPDSSVTLFLFGSACTSEVGTSTDPIENIYAIQGQVSAEAFVSGTIVGEGSFFSEVAGGPTVNDIGSMWNGNLTIASGQFLRSSFAGITFDAPGGLTFLECTFQAGSNPVISSASTMVFDGPSWASFVSAGGTPSSGQLLIIGGVTQGIVKAGLPGSSGTFTITQGNLFVLPPGGISGPGPGPVVYTIGGTGAKAGDTVTFQIGPSPLWGVQVVNGGGGGGVLLDLPPSTAPGTGGTLTAQYDGTNWSAIGTSVVPGPTAKLIATNTSAQSIPSGAVTPIVGYTAVPLDSAGAFDAATGTYGAKYGGFYEVTFSVGWGPGVIFPGNTTIQSFILVNGAQIAQSAPLLTISQQESGSVLVTALLELDTGDAVTFAVQQAAGSNQSLSADPTTNYVTICEVK